MRRFITINESDKAEFEKKIEDILNDNEKDIVDNQYSKEGEEYIAFITYRKPASAG